MISNDFSSENFSDLIKQMKSYIQNDGTKKEKVDKILKEILDLNVLLNKKMSLVFVTDKGVGKTTIINYLLDLIYEKEKKKKNDKKITVYQDVLDTGSGATTTSEVKIVQSEDELNKIEIEPYSMEETTEMIKEFCKIIYKDTFDNFEYIGNLPPEIMRAIRNMTNLKYIELSDKSKIDHAKELAIYYINKYEEFESEVIKRANLSKRNQIKYNCELFDEKKSIRTIFRKINLMHIEEAPLPKKVILKLSKRLFDFDKIGNIESIVDTRGLESGVVSTDRRDIKNLFKYEHDKIIVLVDRFNAPSQSIMKLLDNYILDDKSEIISRLIYMVNFKDGEPENVITGDGEAETEIHGIDYKKDQLISYIKSNEIKIDDNNIIYVNPRRFLDSDGKIKIDEDDLDDYGNVQEARNIKKQMRKIKQQELINSLSKIENSRRNDIIKQINLKKDEFFLIKNKELEGLNINKQLILEDIDKFDIEKYKCIINNSNDIFQEYILSNHPSTLMAINNRYGIYYEKDIYLVGSNKMEFIFNEPFVQLTKNVLNKVYQQASDEKEERIIRFILQDIKNYYYKYIEQINSKFYLCLKEGIYRNDNFEFWDSVVRRWGKGSGYIKDINDFYKYELSKNNLGEIMLNLSKEEMNKFIIGLKNLILESI